LSKVNATQQPLDIVPIRRHIYPYDQLAQSSRHLHIVPSSLPNYAAWWQTHMYVNNLPRVITWK